MTEKAIKKNQTIRSYTIELTTRQPFHIGAFQDPMSDVHNPFTTLGGVPVVQGSSLKGALRAQLEEYLILNYADHNPAMRPCIPAPRNNLSPDERLLVPKKYRGTSCGGQKGQKDQGKPLCPTCYLLGAMGLVGFVQVPYLNLVSETDVEEVYQNRRDRALNTVAHGANRTMQAIPKGAIFRGEMEVLLRDEIRNWTLGQPRKLRSFRDEWLQEGQKWSQEEFIREFILDRLVAIPRLGGMISKGFGGVEIAVTPVG